MEPAEKPHILIVDDDARLRQLLQRYLSEQGWHVTTAQDANDARHKLDYFVYDAAIIDVMMPGENGMQLTQSIKQNHRLPVLLLTAMSEVEDRVMGLESGADDYLGKPFEPRELMLRLRNIMKRTTLVAAVSQQTVEFGDYRFDTDKLTLTHHDQLVALTMSESMLLRELARNIGVAVSRSDLARDAQTEVANERSVDVLITRLRRKIEPDAARPVYILTVRGEGYVLRG
ncbi:MAG: response regulator transcription factor [Rickettsiales bacterium]|nr:response regulator transcription factor [Rickettsiales bacterium]